MRIKKSICFHKERDKELYQCLLALGFEPWEGLFCKVEIFTDDPRWETVNFFVEKYGIHCMNETVFTEQERRQAQWLSMRSTWHNDYPQPIDKFFHITFCNDKYCEECQDGAVQIAPYRLKRQPKWGQRHFFELNWMDDLFVDDVAKNKLQEMNVSSIRFDPVHNKQGTEVLSDVYQLMIDYRLPPCVVPGQDSVRRIYTCSRCGGVRYFRDGSGILELQREAFVDAPDIVVTKDRFGADVRVRNIVLVSQRVYRMIQDNRLGRSLEFLPIKLV